MAHRYPIGEQISGAEFEAWDVNEDAVAATQELRLPWVFLSAYTPRFAMPQMLPREPANVRRGSFV